MQPAEKLGEADTSVKPNGAALASDGTSEAKRFLKKLGSPVFQKLWHKAFNAS